RVSEAHGRAAGRPQAGCFSPAVADRRGEAAERRGRVGTIACHRPEGGCGPDGGGRRRGGCTSQGGGGARRRVRSPWAAVQGGFLHGRGSQPGSTSDPVRGPRGCRSCTAGRG